MIRPAMGRGLALATLAAVVGLATTAMAQDKQRGNRFLRLDAVDTTEIPEGGDLALFTSFLDKQGKPVPVPADGAWTVYYDGEPAAGESKVMLRRETDHPVNLVVVLGATATIESALPDAREALVALIGNLGTVDNSAAIRYTDVVQPTSSLSPKHDDSADFVQKKEGGGASPPLYKAIARGLEFFPSTFDTIGPNRMMYVITDGADVNDRDARAVKSQVESLQAVARDLNVRISVLGVDVDGIGVFDFVRELGPATGGSFAKANTPAEVKTQTDTFASELRGQYVIEVVPKGLPAETEVGFKIELGHGGQTYSTDPVMRMTPKVPSNLMLYLAIGGGGLLALILLILLIRGIVRALGRRREEGPVRAEVGLRTCGQCGNQVPEEWKVCQYCEALPHHGRLTVIGGEGVDEWLTGRAFFIKESQSSIGADDNNNIVLKAPGVSQRHAGIQVQDGRFELADFGSRNGTFINGTRISKQFLKTGDELMFGPVKVEFKLKK